MWEDAASKKIPLNESISWTTQIALFMKTSVVAQLPLLTYTLTRTNCTQSQVDTCSIVQFYGKLKCAKEDGGARNDLIFSCREATYDSFYAKITSRALWPGFVIQRTTGSILTYRWHLFKQIASYHADLFVITLSVNATSAWEDAAFKKTILKERYFRRIQIELS